MSKTRSKMLSMLGCMFVIMLTVSAYCAVSPDYQWTEGHYTIQDTYTVALFHMDQGSGDTVANAVAWGSSGFFHGTPTWGSGQFGNALSFDGTEKIEVPFYYELALDDFTIDFWIKPSDITGQGSQAIVTRLYNYEFWIWPGATAVDRTQVGFYFKDEGLILFGPVKSSADIPFNEWTHVAGTFDFSGDKVARLYINGELDTYTDYSWIFNDHLYHGNYQLFIAGARGDDEHDFNGLIDELRISRIARNFISADVELVGSIPITAIASGAEISWDSRDDYVYDIYWADDGADSVSMGLSLSGTGGIMSYTDKGDTANNRSAPSMNEGREYWVIRKQ
jgi:Concanavalin A-like lectin/glucanases superfamily